MEILQLPTFAFVKGRSQMTLYFTYVVFGKAWTRLKTRVSKK